MRSAIRIAASLFFALAVLAPPCVAESQVSPQLSATFNKMLGALEANDYNAFISEADATVRAALSTQMLQAVNELYGRRMKAGYAAAYLGSLRQQGHDVHLWKLVFNDHGDDALIQLSMRNGKVSGFVIR